ncbi:hypothetical protein KEJ27_09290 [Candidatus Bathyarchaeota archaeon]|nr:hypothetical protein [Candidatus Bathyarchaeota archaeon]
MMSLPLKFIKYDGNPLSIPNYNAVGVIHPDVIYFSEGYDGYKYWMFYTPYPPDSEEEPSLVRSNDGIHFEDAGICNPLVSRGDAVHLADPDVIKVGTTWYMYYMRRYDQNGAINYVIDLATSSDGKKWTKYEKNPVLWQTEEWEIIPENWHIAPKARSVAEPTLYHDGRYFWMWYTGGDNKIGLAKSTDGKNWIKQNSAQPVLEGTPGERDAKGMNHPDVMYYKGKFWMFYVEWSSPRILGLATSVDKVHWKKYQYPILVGEKGKWDESLYRASAAVVNGAIRLYYSGIRDGRPQIGLATSSEL